MSVGRACRVIGLQRSLWYYQSRKNDAALIGRLTELAEMLPTRGFDKYYSIIRQEGLKWARSRVLRVYREMKLCRRRSISEGFLPVSKSLYKSKVSPTAATAWIS